MSSASYFPFPDCCDIFRSRELDRFERAAESVVDHARRGLDTPQVVALAESIAASGRSKLIVDEFTPRTDVPSTGGPGSLSTLLSPLLIAAAGTFVPKVSASGSVAGAIDTMAIIPGFRTRLTPAEFRTALRSAHIAHVEQTTDFCSADRVLIEVRRRTTMMACRTLAAASLLGKKLAIPGTSAAFDFRVGHVGNVGTVTEEARASAKLFLDAAEMLGLRIVIALTDNHSFPSSAVGRVESLELLLKAVQNSSELLDLDLRHIETCIKLAASACAINTRVGRRETIIEMKELLRSGQVYETFEKHLAAQGSDIRRIEKLFTERSHDSRLVLTATEAGCWNPPDLALVKEWHKREQGEVGYKLLVNPGQRVGQGQPVAQVRSQQRRRGWSLPEELRGEVASTARTMNQGVLSVIQRGVQ